MVILWLGALEVIDGSLTAGQLSSFVIYTLYVASNAGMLAGVYSNLTQALGAGERVFELMERQPGMAMGGGLAPAGWLRGNVCRAHAERPGQCMWGGGKEGKRLLVLSQMKEQQRSSPCN
jgi:ABC-type multidrug transport system fused ATPase/permease subunit